MLRGAEVDPHEGARSGAVLSDFATASDNANTTALWEQLQDEMAALEDRKARVQEELLRSEVRNIGELMAAVWCPLLALGLVIMCGRLLEQFLYLYLAEGAMGPAKFAWKFSIATLGILDVDTAFFFATIARQCGWVLRIWALFFLVVGVVILQHVVTLGIALNVVCQEGVRGVFDWGLAKLAHMDCLGSVAPESGGQAEHGPENAGPVFAVLGAAVRFGVEDLPQAVIQVVFTFSMGKNPQVLLSVLVGFLSSGLHVAVAAYGYFKPRGAAAPAE